jgi:hypothetical protein
MRAFLVVLPALLVVACSPVADLPDDFVASLSESGGCGDLTLVATNADASYAFVVEAPDLLAPAIEADEVLRYMWRLPGELRIMALEGSGIAPRACTSLDEAIPKAARTLSGTHGRVEMIVTPRTEGPDGEPRAHVDLTLQEFILREVTGEPAELGVVTMDFDVGPKREGFDIGDVVVEP